MDEKQLQFLYDNYAKGQGFKDIHEFRDLMTDSASRKMFFDESNKELGFKDYDDFETTLDVKKKVGSSNGVTPSDNGLSSTPKVEEVVPIGQLPPVKNTLEKYGIKAPVIPKEQDINQPISTEAVQPKITASYDDFVAHNEERVAKKKELRKQAVDNAAMKVLKNKGVIKPEEEGKELNISQFAQLNTEKERLQQALDNGDATFAISKEGEIGLKKTIGFWDALGKGWNQATKANDDAANFADMDAASKVNFLKEQEYEAAKIAPSEYIGERPSSVGSIGKLAGENAPFLGKAIAGTATGTALILAAPETAGTSLAGLPAATAFLFTANDAKNQGIMSEVTRRFYKLRQENPEGNEVEQMKEAEHGTLAGGMAGILTNAALMSSVKTPLSNMAKGVVGKSITKAVGNAVYGGAATAGIEGTKLAESSLEGVKNTPTEIAKEMGKTFSETATTLGLLHVMTGAVTGALTLPNIVKSAFKYALKDAKPSEIQNTLKANVDAGTITPEAAEKVMTDLDQYKTALVKTPNGLSPEAEASVAGLIQAKDKLIAEMKTKDDTAKPFYEEKIEGINGQIQKTVNTGKPYAHEIDEISGEKYTEKPSIVVEEPKEIPEPVTVGGNEPVPEKFPPSRITVEQPVTFPEPITIGGEEIKPSENGINKEANIENKQGDIKAEPTQPNIETVSQVVEPTTEGTGEPPKITSVEGEVTGGEEWASVRKEKLKEIEGVKEMFDKRMPKKWSEVYKSSLENVQKLYPKKSLYEAMKARVQDFVLRLNNKELFNPTSEDIAVFTTFRAETQKRINEVEGQESDNSIVRQAANMELDNLHQDLMNIAMVTNPEGEAGRAFGMHQSEAMLDVNYGLKIRRMELMKAKGDEKLTPEEEAWVKDKWEQEKELMKQEAAIREQGMKEDFENKISELQKEYEEKLKQKGRNTPQNRTARDKTLKQKGKDIADQIRKLKIQKGDIAIDVTFGLRNLAIEGVAQLVEKGATIADAIKEVLKDVKFKGLTESELTNHIVDGLNNKKDKKEQLQKIKDFAKDNVVTDITNDMVTQNLIRDYVNSHIGEVDQKDILDVAIKDLKEVLPNVTKEKLIEAYLKENEFKQPTKKDLEGGIAEAKKQLNNIAKLTEDIEDLEGLKQIRQRNFPNERAKSETEKELMDKKAAKLKEIKDRRNQIIADNKKVQDESIRQITKVNALKDKKANLEKGIREKRIITKNVDTPEIEGLKQQVKYVDKNLREAESLAKQMDKDIQEKKDKIDEMDAGIKRAENGLNQIKIHRNKTEPQIDAEIEEKKKELKKAINDNATDEQIQAKKLASEKENTKNKIKEFKRKLDEGEFEEKPSIKLKKQDAELIKLKKEQSIIEEAYRKKQKQFLEKKKSGLERAADFARSTYVAILIGAPKTLAKVGAMSIMRPFSEAATKISFGKIFDMFFPNISKAALRGGEGSSIRSIQKGFEAYFRQFGDKKMELMYERASNEYNSAVRAYKEYKTTDNPDAKKLEILKNNMNDKLIKAQSSFIYKFIGGKSLKDAWTAFINRSNEIEKQFGKVESESVYEGNDLDAINYTLGFIGRSHSALKTFSGRFSFAAGFMARLEGAVKNGEDISSGDKVLEIAHESYLDWERGKYQQSNQISDLWNKLTNNISEGETGTPREGTAKVMAALLKTEVAITRVPVNILHEAVMEYTLGAFRAVYLAAKSNLEIRSQLKGEGILPDNPEFQKALKERITQMDEKQAATIARAFRKGGLGVGLYAMALISGAIHFGIFPHLGQKKKKEEKDLKPGELNPGQVMVGDTKLGEVTSGIIEHIPALWTTFMGVGMAQAYKDQIDKGKSTTEAAGSAIYTHLKVIEGSIPQSKIISPSRVGETIVQSVEKKVEDAGLIDKDEYKGFTKEQLNSPVLQWGREKGIKISPPTKKYTDNGEEKIMTDEQYDKYTVNRAKRIEHDLKNLKQNPPVNETYQEAAKKIIERAGEHAKMEEIKKVNKKEEGGYFKHDVPLRVRPLHQ